MAGEAPGAQTKRPWSMAPGEGPRSLGPCAKVMRTDDGQSPGASSMLSARVEELEGELAEAKVRCVLVWD